jgi:glucose dehydrogenase
MPGNNGGANWGGAAVDPQKGRFIVVSKDLPCLLKLAPDATSKDEARFVSGFGFMIAGNGLAAIKPPWTSLTAYDLNAGTIQWSIPLGDGIPAVYEVNGREYLVFCASAQAGLTPATQAPIKGVYLAFALPE